VFLHQQPYRTLTFLISVITEDAKMGQIRQFAQGICKRKLHFSGMNDLLLMSY